MKLEKKTGQSFGEYALTIIIIVTSISVMSVFFQRGLQAKIGDASLKMWQTVNQAVPGVGVDVQYEPYYIETDSRISSEVAKNIELGKGGSSGVFTKDLGETSLVGTTSKQLPASQAD
jgi:hypothetical protein